MRKMIIIVEGIPQEQDEVFSDFMKRCAIEYGTQNSLDVSGEVQVVDYETQEEKEWSAFYNNNLANGRD